MRGWFAGPRKRASQPMNVVSIEFFVPLLLVTGLFFFLPGHRARRFLLTLLNAAFLYTLVDDWGDAAAMGVFLATGYAVVRLTERHPSRRVAAVYIALLLAAFVYVKGYVFLQPVVGARALAHGIEVAGFSYMLFRQIHLLVDVLQRQVRGVGPLGYLNYQLNLFAILAGPIQRYQNFEAYWRNPEPLLTRTGGLLAAYLRILYGVIEVAAIGTFFMLVYDRSYDRIVEAGASTSTGALLLHFLALLYAYPLYLYFNFAGYCDVVIGGAALIGLRLPENFDRPYLSRNLIDFWSRWHRTLGFWVRDYVFTPMYKGIAERWPRFAPSAAFGCYFAAFFLVGVWHGSTLNFVVFGLLQGAGVSAAKLWEQSLIRRGGRKALRRYLASTPIRVVAIAATLHYVALSVLFFPGDMETCWAPLRVVLARLTGGG